ncbi:MAG: hypothetical protein RI567_13985, partial [Marinobacter sp.]|nr:hypothetical protein [Marinobacter sp.]
MHSPELSTNSGGVFQAGLLWRKACFIAASAGGKLGPQTRHLRWTNVMSTNRYLEALRSQSPRFEATLRSISLVAATDA